MIRSIVLVVVLTAFYSPAEALTLSFTDAEQVSVPTNGGIWVTNESELRDCTFTLHRGKAKIGLDLVFTTDRDREYSFPNHFLRPRKPLKTGKPYIMRYSCPDGWQDTVTTTFEGPAIAFVGTGLPDLDKPIWETQPVNTWQKPLCGVCGNSTMEFSMGFSTPVRDESPVRIHATFWKVGSEAPAIRTPLVNGSFNVPFTFRQPVAGWMWSQTAEPLIEVGACYQVSFCATDFAGNQSCLAPQPFVREAESCLTRENIADHERGAGPEIDREFYIEKEISDQWCTPALESAEPASQLPAPESLVAPQETNRLRQLLLLGSCVFLLLLLWSLRRRRLARAQLGQL